MSFFLNLGDVKVVGKNEGLLPRFEEAALRFY